MSLHFFASAGAGPANVSDSSLFTIAKPEGALVNDYLLAAISWSGNTAGWTTPSGWTYLGGSASINGSSALWFKRCGAGEPSSYSWTAVGAVTNAAGGILGYTGGQTNVTPDTQAGQGTTGSPATLASMPNTGAVVDRVAYSAWHASGAGTSPTWTIDAAVTVRVSVSNADCAFKLGDQISPAGAAFPALSSPIANANYWTVQREDFGDAGDSPAHLVEARSAPEFQRRLLKATVQELPYMVTWDMVDEMLRGGKGAGSRS